MGREAHTKSGSWRSTFDLPAFPASLKGENSKVIQQYNLISTKPDLMLLWQRVMVIYSSAQQQSRNQKIMTKGPGEGKNPKSSFLTWTTSGLAHNQYWLSTHLNTHCAQLGICPSMQWTCMSNVYLISRCLSGSRKGSSQAWCLIISNCLAEQRETDKLKPNKTITMQYKLNVYRSPDTVRAFLLYW